MNKGALQVKVSLEDKDIDAQLKALEMKLDDLETKANTKRAMLSLNGKQAIGIDKEKISKELIDIESKAAKTRKQIEKLNGQRLGDLKKSVDNLGNTMGKTVKKIAKLGIAVIGIESARTIFSKAMQSNEKMVKTMENVWLGLSHVLKPVFDWIADKMLYMIAIVNQFIKSLTGIDLIARGNAEALKEQTNAQNKLNKATYSFDEMNISQDSYSSSSSDSTVELPTLTQETIDKVNEVADAVKSVWNNTEGIRDVLKKIAQFAIEHPGLVIGILGGAKLTSLIASIIGVAGGTTGLLGIAAALWIINGISIANLIDEFKEYEKVLNDVKDVTNKNAENAQLIKQNFEEATDANEQFTKQVSVFINDMNGASKSTADLIGNLSWWGIRLAIVNGDLKKYEEILKKNLDTEKETIDAFELLYEKTDKTEEQTKRYIELLTSYKQSLVDVNTEINSNSDAAYMLSDVLEDNGNEIARVDEKIRSLNNILENNKFETLTNDAEGSSAKLSSVKDMLDGIKSKSVKLTVDAETSKAQTSLKNLFNNFSSTASNILGKLGLNISFPKLATGGIVNNPGRGVISGNYIAGESGKEGIIPLTDASAMSQLGYEIGKWITVNNTVNNYMNGRLIQRNMTQQSEEEKFARNGD